MGQDKLGDPYAGIADFYDLEHQDFGDDVSFYRMLADSSHGPVLELACGSGRLLLPLARDGRTLVGVDQSADMLARARFSIAREEMSARVNLVKAPMVEAATIPGGPFGLVFIALNGLLHETAPEGQRATLSSACQALAPGGQLALDLVNPTPATLQGFDGSIIHEGRWHLPRGATVDKFSSRFYQAFAQEIETTIWYDTMELDGTLRRRTTHFTMRYLHGSELELLLELAGFASCRLFGSYELDPLTDESDRLIAIAIAPD